MPRGVNDRESLASAGHGQPTDDVGDGVHTSPPFGRQQEERPLLPPTGVPDDTNTSMSNTDTSMSNTDTSLSDTISHALSSSDEGDGVPEGADSVPNRGQQNESEVEEPEAPLEEDGRSGAAQRLQNAPSSRWTAPQYEVAAGEMAGVNLHADDIHSLTERMTRAYPQGTRFNLKIIALSPADGASSSTTIRARFPGSLFPDPAAE